MYRAAGHRARIGLGRGLRLAPDASGRGPGAGNWRQAAGALLASVSFRQSPSPCPVSIAFPPNSAALTGAASPCPTGVALIDRTVIDRTVRAKFMAQGRSVFSSGQNGRVSGAWPGYG